MLFVEVMVVQCEIVQNTWKPCGEKFRVFSVETDGLYSNHLAVKENGVFFS